MAAGPLLSWDIFIESYHRRIALAEDLQLLKKMSRKNNWCCAWDTEERLIRQGKVILVTDPLLTIVFASSNLLQMNGYLPEEVISKTPKLFQGEDTCRISRQMIREAIRNQQPFKATLLNYRKNGTTYDCEIEGLPVFNRSQQLVHFIAFESILA